MAEVLVVTGLTEQVTTAQEDCVDALNAQALHP